MVAVRIRTAQPAGLTPGSATVTHREAWRATGLRAGMVRKVGPGHRQQGGALVESTARRAAPDGDAYRRKGLCSSRGCMFAKALNHADGR